MNKPKIRFKGFEGEWKEMQFEVAFEYQRNNSLSRAELSDEGIVANIHYGDVLIKYGECLDVSKDVLTYVKDKKISMALYKKGALRNGDVIFADAAEDNTVGKCTEVICEENVCIVSGLHTIACRPQVEFVERYLGYSLNSPSFHNQLLPHIQGTKISSISKNALSSTSISLPSLPEQRAIAASTSRLSSLKQIKAASLLNMFPQKGETVPRVRFKGFQGEWKEIKLGEIFSVEIGEFVIKTKQKNNAPYPVYNGGVSNTGFYDCYNQEGPKIIVSARGANAGYVNYCTTDFWAGNSCYSIGAKNNDELKFFFYFLKRFQEIYMKNQYSASIPSISKQQILRTNLIYPSLPEQRAIASYFTALDAQITLQRERLEKLKQIKAACLEKMFA